MTVASLTARFGLCAGALLASMTAPAQAAFISTAGTGFVPVVFDGSGPVTLNIDLNNDGAADFVISGATNNYPPNSFNTGTPITIAAGNNAVYVSAPSFAGAPYDRTVAFPNANFGTLPAYTSSYASTAFQTGTYIIANQPNGGYSEFHFVGPSETQHVGFIEVELIDAVTSAVTVGYVAGTYFDGNTSQNAIFTVTDFGIDVAVPEPGSLVVLTMALMMVAGGRRAARRGASPALR